LVVAKLLVVGSEVVELGSEVVEHGQLTVHWQPGFDDAVPEVRWNISNLRFSLNEDN
jgi:hypothetical protein